MKIPAKFISDDYLTLLDLYTILLTRGSGPGNSRHRPKEKKATWRRRHNQRPPSLAWGDPDQKVPAARRSVNGKLVQ